MLTYVAVLRHFRDTFRRLMDVLGVAVEREQTLLDEEIEALMKERQQARQNRDFARADEIRDTLKERGILLEDTPQGPRWKRG